MATNITDNVSLRAAIDSKVAPFAELTAAEIDALVSTAKFVDGKLSHAEYSTIETKHGEEGVKAFAELCGIEWKEFVLAADRMCTISGWSIGCSPVQGVYCDPNTCK